MKRPWASKLNWIGLTITLLGVVMDPQFQEYLGMWVPEEVMGKVVSGAGMLVMVVRTCCTNQPVNMRKARR
jgi:hypothetical protein